MKIFTFGFAVVIMAVSTGLPFSLRADEEKQDPSAVDEAGEKSDAEKSKELRAKLLKELRSGSPADAVKSLDAAIEESPEDAELPLMRQQLVSRLVSANMTAQAVEQAEKLIAFQLGRVQDASPVENMSLASSAQMLSALYQREKKPAEATKITNAALEALRSVGAKDEDDVYLASIPPLVRAVAQNLAMEEKFTEADEILKAECSVVQKKFDGAEAIESPVRAWSDLMQARISIARRAELETAQALAEELETGILAAIEKKPKSQILMSKFITNRSVEVARIYRDAPATAQELLINTVEFFDASELKDDNSVRAIVDRLKA
ncbi:MAG: hypothetical protein O2856_19250, partial [Planctomycetota bacterium]|nr:hypothetical protein [Planctomycetota bacterium]